MKFDITAKDQDGNIVVQGTASQAEASFIFNVGLSYLLANGTLPLLTGKDELPAEHDFAEEPTQTQ